MQYVEVREYLINVNNIVYLDRFNGRLVLKNRLVISLTYDEVQELLDQLIVTA